MRSRRVRLAHTVPQGRQYDLVTLFDQLNQRYLAGCCSALTSGGDTKLAAAVRCYDPGPNQILLNRRMDRAGIPQFVVEYVLYTRCCT